MLESTQRNTGAFSAPVFLRLSKNPLRWAFSTKEKRKHAIARTHSFGIRTLTCVSGVISNAQVVGNDEFDFLPAAARREFCEAVLLTRLF